MPTLYAALDDRVLVVRGQRRSHCAQGTQWDCTERLREHDIECLAASAERPERVFVGTVDSGLKRSTDGGETWHAAGDLSDRVTAVTVSPHDPETVWVGTEPSAVYRSTDGGVSFEQRDGLTDLPGADRWSFPPRPHTHHVRSLAVHPTDPDRLYVAIEAGAFVRSDDGGESWQPHPEGARRDNHTLAIHPDAPSRVYTAAGDGYAESTDCGERWTYPQDGLDHRYVWSVAVDSGDPETVVVSAARGARTAHTPARAESYVYRKSGPTDGWELAMDGLGDPDGTVRAVLSAGEGAGEFAALTNRGIFRSHDAAKTWHRLAVPWSEAYEQTVGRGLAVV
jgi:photosystem II stability/assembly factor-like uncharacterized protein